MSADRLLVVGGDAAGMSAAAQARRLRPELCITVLEQGPDVSYSACGIPYWVGDVVSVSSGPLVSCFLVLGGVEVAK